MHVEMYGSNGCKGCISRCEDGKLLSASRTVVLKHYIFYQDYWAVSRQHCPHYMLTSGHTQANWKGIKSITLLYKLVVWNCWQMIDYNESVLWWNLCILYLFYLFILLYCVETVKLPDVYHILSCTFKGMKGVQLIFKVGQPWIGNLRVMWMDGWVMSKCMQDSLYQTAFSTR